MFSANDNDAGAPPSLWTPNFSKLLTRKEEGKEGERDGEDVVDNKAMKAIQSENKGLFVWTYL